MAATTVLNTTELVEHILAQGLPTKDVTRARQINSFTRSVIDNSKILRRIIFLEPISERDHKTFTVKSIFKVRANGLLAGSPKCVATTIHPAIRCSHVRDDCLLIDVPTTESMDKWNNSMLICNPPAKSETFRLLTRPRLTSFGKGSVARYTRFKLTIFKGNTLGALGEAIRGLGTTVEVTGVQFGGVADERLQLSKEELEALGSITAMYMED